MKKSEASYSFICCSFVRGPDRTISPLAIINSVVVNVAVAVGRGVDVGMVVGVNVKVGVAVIVAVEVGCWVSVKVGMGVPRNPNTEITSGALDCGMKRKPTKKRLARSAPMPNPRLRYFIFEDRMSIFYRLFFNLLTH